jgi:hypothetical protein
LGEHVEPRLIDRQRLDVVLAEAARTATDPATRAQVEAFESLIRTRYKDSQRLPFDSIRDQIADFIMPRVGNLGVFSSTRYMQILGDVAEQILPSMGENDDVSGIAIAVIKEEMQRHRELQERIYQALGA